jgi:hypothetical protein
VIGARLHGDEVVQRVQSSFIRAPRLIENDGGAGMRASAVSDHFTRCQPTRLDEPPVLLRVRHAFLL